MSPFGKLPVRVQPYLGYRSRDRLMLSARALRSRAPQFEQSTRIQALRTMLSQFASPEAEGVAVTLEVIGKHEALITHEMRSDHEGYVHFNLPLEPRWDLPEHPVWETARLNWVSSEGPHCVEAHVLVPGRDSNLAVISDIDDTIIETGITGGLKSIARNWRRLLAEFPHERIAVDGADQFYGHLGGGMLAPDAKRAAERIPATHRPFFYISSSPWNLFSYLTAFIRMKGLPLGPLLLRDWGFNRDTLGKESHGAHKGAAIDSVLGMYPELRFALIGDDTQGDLPAFARAVCNHPGRIAAVFLRTVSEQSLSPAEQAAQAEIEASGVPLWLGDSFAAGLDFLRTLGFTPGGETEQIVKVVEKVPTGPAESSGPPSGGVG